MTLREALQMADLDKVYKWINKKDSKNAFAGDRPSLEQTTNSYKAVVWELLKLPKTKPYSMPWLVKESIDPFDKKKYPDVCFFNPKYVAPAKGLKPWGCTKGEKPPKGYYDCNSEKHNRTFSAGWTPWSKVIDTSIIIEVSYPLERVVAEILWEMTFYGWTENKVEQTVKDIDSDIEKAKKEIEEGKCIEIPPKKKGDYKVVIPNSVVKFIKNIGNKK